MALVQSKVYCLDLRDYRRFNFVLVVASLGRHSNRLSYGAHQGDITEDTRLSWDVVRPIVDELLDADLMTVQEHQIGTGGTKDTFYKLADDCSAELALKLGAPSTDK